MSPSRFGQAAKFTLVFVTLMTGASAGTTEKILHSFDVHDGAQPSAGLIFDAQGNLYGTTVEGGPNGYGIVFELSPASNGGWTHTILHSFSNNQGGSIPSGSVIFDGQGNLFGTTESGGAHGKGTVFELTPDTGGKWKETVLHSFEGGSDGENPVGALVFDSTGSLYGTTPAGGSPSGLGTVFKLAPVEGHWKETTIHRFNGGKGGNAPLAGLVVDVAGNLYGTTAFGGSAECGGSGCGVVFQLTPTGSEKWIGRVLHRFKGGSDGMSPECSLIFDVAGNLYGTTVAGGNAGCVNGFGCGTVFELSPTPESGWKEKIIHRFKGGSDGSNPRAGLVLDERGDLYGTTNSGGGSGCGLVGCGTVFELSPPGSSGGKWRGTVLHRFNPRQGDGSGPIAEPILDGAGNVFGTTVSGGTSDVGVVFEIAP